jgi:hypothetical protein
MTVPRSDHKAAVLNDKLYAIGGTSDGTEVLRTVETLDLLAPHSGWKMMSTEMLQSKA